MSSASEDGAALFGAFHNFGVRSPDAEADVSFLELFGATNLRHTFNEINGVRSERFHLDFGGTKIALFRRASYDGRLEAMGQTRGGGISHAAFTVRSTDAILKRAAERGIEPLLGPFTVQNPTRLITFFRSPNGMILETQETLS